jgi:hypothetical protein
MFICYNIITPLELKDYTECVIFCVVSRYYLHMIEINDCSHWLVLLYALIIKYVIRNITAAERADGYFSGPASAAILLE